MKESIGKKAIPEPIFLTMTIVKKIKKKGAFFKPSLIPETITTHTFSLQKTN